MYIEEGGYHIFLERLLFAIRFPPSREGRQLISGVVLWYTFLQIWSNDKRNFSCRSVRIRTRTRPRIGFVHSRLSYIYTVYRYVLVYVHFDHSPLFYNFGEIWHYTQLIELGIIIYMYFLIFLEKKCLWNINIFLIKIIRDILKKILIK